MRQKGSAFRLSLRLLLSLLLLGFALPILAKPEFKIEQVQVRQEQGTLLLSANVTFDFSATALEALSNGVPLTVMTHIQIRRTDAWMWEDSLLDQQLRSAVRYKPLSERYEVYRLPGTSGRNFETRDAAIRALGEISDLPLINKDELEPDEAYELQIRVDLDIEELPLPLRPVAYLRPSWQLTSGWRKWPIKP